MSSWWCQLGVFGVGIQLLVGAFKYFLFSSLLGEDEPILTNQFQLAWFNHQLAATRRFFDFFCFCGFSTRCLFRFHPPQGVSDMRENMQAVSGQPWLYLDPWALPLPAPAA